MTVPVIVIKSKSIYRVPRYDYIACDGRSCLSHIECWCCVKMLKIAVLMILWMWINIRRYIWWYIILFPRIYRSIFLSQNQ